VIRKNEEFGLLCFFLLFPFFFLSLARWLALRGRQEEGDTGDWERREEIFFEEREREKSAGRWCHKKKKEGKKKNKTKKCP